MIELSKYLKELLKQYKPYDKEIFNSGLDIEMYVVWNKDSVYVLDKSDKVNKNNIHKITLKDVIFP